MSVNLAEVWAVISPRIGIIASFGLGCVGGGLLMSKNFTVQAGDFIFSTKNDDHALQLMKENYRERAKHLLEKSQCNLAAFESEDTTEDAKKELVKNTIDYYLTATSHDKLFSRDVVIFNGKDKPTIMVREEFDQVRDNWVRLLSTSSVKKCVDGISDDFSPYDTNVSKKACNECMKNFSSVKRSNDK